MTGLFEGEGTILIRKRPEDQIALSLSSTDEDIVRKFAAIVGIGKVYGPYSYSEGRKPFWKWNADNGFEVFHLLSEMAPRLGNRRYARAKEAATRWLERQTRPHYTVSRKGMGGKVRKNNGAEHVKEKLKKEAA